MRVVPLLSLLAGCLMPDLSDTLDPGPPPDTGLAPVIVDDDGAELLVDATSYEAWVSLDLDTLAVAGEPLEGEDLAFQRYFVDLADGLEAAAVEGVDFESLTEVPVDGWRVDEPDADDDGIPEYALADWYDYDQDTHTLTPADRVYAVRFTEQGAAFKLGFLSYYDEAGTPARLSLRVAPLEAP